MKLDEKRILHTAENVKKGTESRGLIIYETAYCNSTLL